MSKIPYYDLLHMTPEKNYESEVKESLIRQKHICSHLIENDQLVSEL